LSLFQLPGQTNSDSDADHSQERFVVHAAWWWISDCIALSSRESIRSAEFASLQFNIQIVFSRWIGLCESFHPIASQRQCILHWAAKQNATPVLSLSHLRPKTQAVENRHRFSERVSCENDSDFRLRKSALVFDRVCFRPYVCDTRPGNEANGDREKHVAIIQ